MPTYFGPINIPPLEVFQLGTSVIYAGLPRLREQVGKAALFVELDNPGCLAEHLYNLSAQPDLQEKLVDSGRIQLQKLTAHSEDWLEKAVKRYQVIQSMWSAE